MGQRNPIHVIGDPARKGVTYVSDDLIRAGAHRDALGSDGFVVMAYLLSCATAPQSTQRPWETSAVQIAEQFGWPRNRRRVTAALEAAEKNGRLVIRKYVRNGVEVPRMRDYVVCAGGRCFTDAEVSYHSTPVELRSTSKERPEPEPADPNAMEFW